MAVVQMKKLLESGVHFGHQTRRWNPKMAPYIYTSRHGIHIIDLQQTVQYIEDMYQKFADIAKDGGKVLFVGTKKQAADAIKEEAVRAGQFYVSKRWLGGTLTNFKTIRKSIRRLNEIEKMEADGVFAVLPKKEVIGLRKEMARLDAFLSGIRDMRTLPSAVFIIDPLKEINAIKEARKLKIPVFGIADTNCDPDDLDFLIPANDDAIRSVRLILRTMANALVEGSSGEVVVDEDEDNEETPVSQKPIQKPSKVDAKKEAPKKDVAPEPKKEAPKKEAVASQPNEEAPKQSDTDLSGLTVAELKALAKEKGMSGYSKLKKEELIALLK